MSVSIYKETTAQLLWLYAGSNKSADDMYRALSRSHDAWALIALIALLSAILVLGLLWKYMVLGSVLVLLIRITRAPRVSLKFPSKSV